MARRYTAMRQGSRIITGSDNDLPSVVKPIPKPVTSPHVDTGHGKTGELKSNAIISPCQNTKSFSLNLVGVQILEYFHLSTRSLHRKVEHNNQIKRWKMLVKLVHLERLYQHVVTHTSSPVCHDRVTILECYCQEKTREAADAGCKRTRHRAFQDYSHANILRRSFLVNGF